MVMSAYRLVVVCGERPVEGKDCVLLRGDNEAAVNWARCCRGGKESRLRALMCLTGAVELVRGWKFYSLPVLGVLNAFAKGISRWNPGDIHM